MREDSRNITSHFGRTSPASAGSWLLCRNRPLWKIRLRAFATFTVVIAVAVTLAPRCSFAQAGLGGRFEQHDKNGDGKITRDELRAAAVFKRLDLDGDGEITKREATKAVLDGALSQEHLRDAPAGGQEDPDPSPAESPVRQGPQVVRPGDHGVGRFIRDVSFTDLTGQDHTISDFANKRITVMAMTSTSCPLSKKYLPTLVEMVKSADESLAWILVNPVATDDVEEMSAASAQLEGRAIYVQDPDGQLAARIGALTTTDVVVIDPRGTVVYHGAVDDQYGFGYSRDEPRYRYLADALSAIRLDQQPVVAATRAPGCVIRPAKGAVVAAEVTYHNRISRLMQQHCVECHREGGVGPFALDTYEDVVAHSAMIGEVVQQERMPPWFAAPQDAVAGTENVHSPWANDRSLADSEKQDLLEWTAGDTPEGDVSDAPRPRGFEEGWLIGEPDAIFRFEQPVQVEATGTMPYQNIYLDTHLEEDRWVRAIEIRPGNMAVVHHVLVFVREPGSAEDESDDDDDETGFWGIYVPGNSNLIYPDGFAKRMPKGARLRFQMHYTPNGSATTDQTSLGVIFADEPPRHEVRVAGIVNTRLNIPPGADNHREVATLRVPTDARVMGFLPHMHLRGKACRYELTRADGKTTTLLDIPRYDFNWQLLYRYIEPLSVSTGDTLRFTAWYDNSENNPANPDPTKTVRWGPQTFDEMQLGYVEYYVP